MCHNDRRQGEGPHEIGTAAKKAPAPIKERATDKKRNQSQLTEADEDPLESLVRAGLQIKQGELVISAVLHLVTYRLEQYRRPVQLERRTKTC